MNTSMLLSPRLMLLPITAVNVIAIYCHPAVAITSDTGNNMQ